MMKDGNKNSFWGHKRDCIFPETHTRALQVLWTTALFSKFFEKKGQVNIRKTESAFVPYTNVSEEWISDSYNSHSCKILFNYL